MGRATVGRELLGKVVNAFAASAAAPDDERRVLLLQLQAHGATAALKD